MHCEQARCADAYCKSDLHEGKLAVPMQMLQTLRDMPGDCGSGFSQWTMASSRELCAPQ